MLNFLIYTIGISISESTNSFRHVDFADSWKLYKITENGVEQPYEDGCTLFYDPNGNYGCFNKADNEIFIWGKWTRKKNNLYIESSDMNYEPSIHSWSSDEIVISTVEQKGRKYFFKK